MPEYLYVGPEDEDDFNDLGYDDDALASESDDSGSEDMENEDYGDDYETEMELDDFDDDDDDDMFEEEDILFSEDDDDLEVDQEQTEARKDIWSNMDWDKD